MQRVSYCAAALLSVIGWSVCLPAAASADDFGPIVVLGQSSSSQFRLFGFEQNGAYEDTRVLSAATTGNQLPSSVATHAGQVFVGDFAAGKITTYSRRGDLLGTFSLLEESLLGDDGLVGRIEADAGGNVYAALLGSGSAARTSVRFDAEGTVSATFVHADLVFPHGIDADADGNVFIVNSADVGAGDRLFKFTATGTFVGSFAIPQTNNPSDLAIDERHRVAYVSDQFGGSFGIKAYDISGPSLTYLGAIPTPMSLLALSYSQASGHLYGVSWTNVGGAVGTGYEFLTDGTLVDTFQTSPNTMYLARDIVLSLPEPSGLALALLGLVALAGGASLGRAGRLRSKPRDASSGRVD